MFQRIVTYWDTTSFYLSKKVFYIGVAAASFFIISFFLPLFFTLGIFLLIVIAIAVLIDAFLLYQKKGIKAQRSMSDRFSNGDENKIVLQIQNSYSFVAHATIIEELPYQFQINDWTKRISIKADDNEKIEYYLKPLQRGEYYFGKINIYIIGPLKLVKRRYITGEERVIKVYPSVMQMRRFQLMAVANTMQETGVKRMRKLGHSLEFEQIKEYVTGDDYRTLNWKATARKGDLMVNNFTDEKSQQIYCIINKGRIMKMPFEGMTLLDYAINTALVISAVALQKQDKAGMIAFSQNLDAFLPADKKPTQLNLLLENLYKQKTNFLEPDFEKLYSVVRNRITHRSLLILFTNFESFESFQRELPALKKLAHYHLLMVIFFENTEIKDLIESKASTVEDIYIKTIAEKYKHEKQLIAKELQINGIISLLTTPEKLSINTLNKYLELKNRQKI